MDLQNIQEQLNTEFAKESTRIIFWFDDKGEYEDEVAELCLDNATLHEKFTLKSREYRYGDKYYLHLVDANDDKNILQSYEFMIDIAFVDDFGF